MGDAAQSKKGMAALCYFSLLLVIPAICCPKDDFVRFHLNQGLVLLIANLIFGAITFIPPLKLVGDLFNCLVLVLAVLGIVHACRGERKPLPLLGGITLLR